jgi:hypothetical protein
MSGDEHSEQVAVVAYLQMSYPDVLFWATPNGAMMGGGRAGAIRMNALKAEGLLPGVSDLILFEPRGGYAAMFLEMKRADGGSGASENQLWFIRQVEKRGAFGIVCNGYDEAQVVIDDYLNGRMIKQVLDNIKV